MVKAKHLTLSDMLPNVQKKNQDNYKEGKVKVYLKVDKSSTFN